MRIAGSIGDTKMVKLWNPWTKELSGIGGIGARVGRKMLVKGRKDTLYFKFKGVN